MLEIFDLELIGKPAILGFSVTILAVLLVVLYGSYNVFLHPLRHYPGPLIWRAFRLRYVISIHRGDFHLRLKEFHDKYGLVVRVAPNELSYADGAAWKDIYGNRPGHPLLQKNPTTFQKMNPNDPKSIMSPDEDAHSRMRKAFANAFSEKSLKDQSPLIEGHIQGFMSQLKSRSGKPIDLVEWLNFLTFDISGDLSFGESFDCVKNGKAHTWVEIANGFGRGLAIIATVNLYPPLNKTLHYLLPKKLMQRQMDHREISAAKAEKRLAMDTDRPDFVTPVKKFNEKRAGIQPNEWSLNMGIIVFAGSETTATGLAAIVRELLQNPGVLARLTSEIRERFEEERHITIATTGNHPYLDAVINEGLRIAPPAVVGVPRIAPPGGVTICGRHVPKGTYVAVNQFPANRLERNFRYPNSFIPERFLDNNPKTDNLTAFQPFGIGRHSCIGMKLAFAEMRLVLSRLLYSFNIVLADPKDRWDWGTQPSSMFWVKKPLRVVLRKSGRT
ncbi:cytochrome P450 [Clohesyomyces aquaticus]|uniref:Cytochrome P450 n=1 Tax=Clohesyomyces aquaticus TaxID=1231657 RepID=A0A1Y1YYM1_9PLEO|nr:cytochrome P450 [Clohesyomyces aquaticus]